MEVRPIYPSTEADSYLRRIEHYLSQKTLSEADAETIRNFISYKTATQSIASNRLLKITGILCSWRTRFLDANFTEITNDQWIASAGFIRISNLKQNTIRDYLIITRNFLVWLLENGRNKNLTLDAIMKIKLVPRQKVTKTPDMLVTDEEVLAMLHHPHCRPMTAALVAVLYFTGMRPSEALRLQWKDLEFADNLLKIRITDTKNGGKNRYAPTSEAIEYVANWRNHYPKEIPGGPNRDNCVFVSMVCSKAGAGKQYQSMSYAAASKQVTTLSSLAIGRKVNLYIFRASDITNSAAKGVPDSVNKAIHWGNQSTTMLETYLLLKDSQIETAILKRAGVKMKESSDENKTRNILCNYCYTINAGGSHYCRTCGRPLGKVAIQSHPIPHEKVEPQQKRENIEEMIRSVAGAFGMSFGDFIDKIRKMKNSR